MSAFGILFRNTGVIAGYAYHTAICNGMHILNKENTG